MLSILAKLLNLEINTSFKIQHWLEGLMLGNVTN